MIKCTLPVFSLMAMLLPGCATEPSPLTSEVQPLAASAEHAQAAGTLVVFSATHEHVIGDGPAYHPHSGYVILNEQGAQVKYVPNHVGNMDEAPQTIGLPAGKYLVKAEADGFGRVTVPVVIAAFRVTEVHLTGKSKLAATASKQGEAIRLSDGTAVGWAGSH